MLKRVDAGSFVAEALSLAKEGHLYRLVDPSLSAERELEPDALKKARLIKNPFLAQKPSEQLYLQQVEPESVAQLISYESESTPLERLKPVPFCGWIISKYPARTVATYIQRQISQMSPGGRSACLRFYDPRVMQQLVHILSSKQLSTLLGPIDQWVIFTEKDALLSIEPHDDLRALGRINFNPEQWQAIKRTGLVNRCLELYRTLPEDDKSGTVSSQDVASLLAIAEEYGLKGQDLMAFVLHGLVTTPKFYLHPQMQGVLRRVDDHTSYIELTDRFSDTQWDAISTGKVEETL